MNQKEALTVKHLAKPVYDAIPIIAKKAGRKWEWEPEWNELVLHNQIIGSYQGSQEGGSYLVLRPKDKYDIVVPKKECIPILDWETIEEILEGMGYIVKVRDNEGFGEECKYNCGIYKGKLGVGMSAKTRQESAMLAVQELRREVEK